MYKRSLNLSEIKRSFFLWGPRQVGKSSLLQDQFKDCFKIDLLKSDQLIKYQQKPWILREELSQLKERTKFIIIDEIQKVPALLDEVHGLIENEKMKFVLCGSSARKLKKGHANLLGGRALRRDLFGFSSSELAKDFSLLKAVNRGSLPNHYLAENDEYNDLIRSYCADYLKEEIMAEGLVRNLPAFSQFLNIASFSDTETVEFRSIARDIGVSAPTIKSYFEILEDTLIGKFLMAYRKRPKRRIQTAPKFYFFDVGVVNHLAKRGKIEAESELFGKAFENWVFHELRCYKAYRQMDAEISFWRLSTGIEVDFIINDMELAIEVKASSSINPGHLRNLRELIKDQPQVKRRIVVCNEKLSRRTEDKIEILSFADFSRQLWAGELF
jgi:predicted AAA+ superfamily ATPase